MTITRGRTILALTTAGLLALGAGSALAAPGDVTATFTAGGLNGTAGEVSATGIALTGAEQDVALTSTPWSATDGRGVVTGWSASVAASALTNGGSTIANSAISISTPDPTPGPSADATPFTGVQSVLAALSGSVSLFTAAGPNGGTYSFTPLVSLHVPANARAGSYTGTLTYTLTPTA
jgi:hypothetical protein